MASRAGAASAGQSPTRSDSTTCSTSCAHIISRCSRSSRSSHPWKTSLSRSSRGLRRTADLWQTARAVRQTILCDRRVTAEAANYTISFLGRVWCTMSSLPIAHAEAEQGARRRDAHFVAATRAVVSETQKSLWLLWRKRTVVLLEIIGLVAFYPFVQ